MVLCHNQAIPHQNTPLAASQRNNNCQNSNLCFPFLSWCSAIIPVIISLCKHSVSYFRSSSDETLFPVQDVNLRALIAGRSLFRLYLSGTTNLLTFDNAVLGKIQGDGRKFLDRFKSYFCRRVVWGVEGKQVGSMDEESQVRGCYNITFICTPTNQETVCFRKDTSKQNIQSMKANV